MCLALECFAISFSTSFVTVGILINDACLPHKDKRKVVPYTEGLQGCKRLGLHGHTVGCAFPKTQPASSAPLALQSLRAWTLDAGTQGKP